MKPLSLIIILVVAFALFATISYFCPSWIMDAIILIILAAIFVLIGDLIEKQKTKDDD